MFCCIIYVQGGETLDEVEKLFNEQIYEAAISYLSQWDYGAESEYDDALTENLPNGVYIDTYQHNGYYLLRWCGIGDYALYRKID